MVKPKNIIYALQHDSSKHVYIGKSTSGLCRPRNHGRPSVLKNRPHLPVVRWVKKLQSRGYAYNIIILEECTTPEELYVAEQYYIALFRWMNMSLLNCTDGGEGTIGRKHSQETRDKIAAKAMGRMPSEETRKKISCANKGRKLPPEEVARIRARMQGKRLVPLAIKRAARTNRGRKHSPEVRARISQSHKDKKHTEEEKLKIAIAHFGMKHTLETRIKMSEIAKQRHAKKRLDGMFG